MRVTNLSKKLYQDFFNLNSINNNLIIEEMRRDYKINMALDIRVKEFDKFNLIIKSESLDAKKILEKEIDFIRSISKHMLKESLIYGTAFIEIVWKFTDDCIILKNFIIKNPKNFKIIEGRILTKDNIEIEDGKLIYYTNSKKMESDNEGESEILKCKEIYLAKKKIRENLNHLIEVSAKPLIIAKVKDDINTTNDELTELSEHLEYTRQRRGSLVTEGIDEIKVIESKGQILDYYKALEEEEKRIVNIITGQTLTTEDGKYGSKAQSGDHLKSLENLALSDAKNIIYTLNRSLVKWILKLNKINTNAEILLD